MSSRCFFCTISSNGKSTPSALTVTRSRIVKSPRISSVERIAPGQSGIERGAKGSQLQDAVKPNKKNVAITNEVDFVNPDEPDGVISNQLNAVILEELSSVTLNQPDGVIPNELDAAIRCGTAILLTQAPYFPAQCFAARRKADKALRSISCICVLRGSSEPHCGEGHGREQITEQNAESGRHADCAQCGL